MGNLNGLEEFTEIWAVDFEFAAPAGERPMPICMVARELRQNKTLRPWTEDLLALSKSPVPVRDNVLFIAYYASAELGCYKALGWPTPTRILDLFAEFRVK